MIIVIKFIKFLLMSQYYNLQYHVHIVHTNEVNDLDCMEKDSEEKNSCLCINQIRRYEHNYTIT